MKIKDLEPGMRVACKMGFAAREACILEVGHWRHSMANGANRNEFAKGIAIAYRLREDWSSWLPDIVQAQQILCPWDEHLANEARRKERAQDSMAEGLRIHAESVARFNALRPAFTAAGVELVYGAAVVLSIEEAEKVAAAITRRSRGRSRACDQSKRRYAAAAGE